MKFLAQIMESVERGGKQQKRGIRRIRTVLAQLTPTSSAFIQRPQPREKGGNVF